MFVFNLLPGFRPELCFNEKPPRNGRSGKTRPFLFSWNIFGSLLNLWLSGFLLTQQPVTSMWAFNGSVHCFGFNCKGQYMSVGIYPDLWT